MYVIEKLKLNKFLPVSVPRNKDLYARVGGRIPSLGTTGFTSEMGKSKLDLLSDSERALEAEMNGALAGKVKPADQFFSPDDPRSKQ